MKRKLVTISILCMLLSTTALASASGDSVSSFILPLTQPETNTLEDSYSDEDVARLVESITIGSIIQKIRDQLQQSSYSTFYKKVFASSIATGINALQKYGITQDMTLAEADDALTTGIFNKKSERYLPFLFNVLPTVALVSTTLEPMVYNLTDDNPSDVLAY